MIYRRSNLIRAHVWGPFACFNRHDQSIEKVSYDVMTPSAARNILQSIFWKPEFNWHIKSVGIVKKGKKIPIETNEVKKRGSSVVEKDRVQRMSLSLYDVSYVIEAFPVPHRTESPSVNARRYRNEMQKRLRNGKFFSRPYLGLRQYHCFFSDEDVEVDGELSYDIGKMLFDWDYKRGKPILFDAEIEDGWLDVPMRLYEITHPVRDL